MARKKRVEVLIGTRKGAFILTGTDDRATWDLSDPIFLGHIINHFAGDPRNDTDMLMAAKTGHLGPTVFRSTDNGKNWKEAASPPAFAKAAEGEKGRVVDRTFWLTSGHASEEGSWYLGTSPAGLFRSVDRGESWVGVDGFNENSKYSDWTGVGPTPDGQFLHSIIVDPRDKKHLYFGISVGGIFESTDGGGSWKPLNKGVAADFLPSEAEYGHDPHCIVLHPASPDRLYHQNHCGIYRIDRPSNEWIRIGDNMPKEIKDIGFPIVVDPKDPDTAWVFPMDGTEVWPRTSPDGRPAVYMTNDGGESWKRQDRGFPKSHAYFTVKRQSMCVDNCDPLGLYLGTTGGEVWASFNEGKSWKCLVRHLPEIYCVRVRGVK